jgi:hypothetical protein
MSITIDKSIAPATYDNLETSGAARAQEVVKPNETRVMQQVVENNNADESEKVKTPATQSTENTSIHKDTFTLTYDNLAGISVLKSFDSKGNVVTQTPPAQHLKMMELDGRDDEEAKGNIISKQV